MQGGILPKTDEQKWRQITGVNAFNEMKLLQLVELAGNHLVVFGLNYLLVEQSIQRWEHKRLINLSAIKRLELKQENWQFIINLSNCELMKMVFATFMLMIYQQ